MSGYPNETRELAYQRWSARVPLTTISEELGVSLRTLESWRVAEGWVAREARGAAARMERQRWETERRLSDELPKLLEQALSLAYGAKSERVQFEAIRFLLGTLGYSPDTSADRLRTLASTLALPDEQDQRDTATIAAELNALLGFHEPNPLPASAIDGAGPE